MLGCDEMYTKDMTSILYFDSAPHRTGLCYIPPIFFFPFTCCGPPQVYTFKPKCCCIDMQSCYGVQIKTAPCKCCGFKQCCCCGNPCFECCGVTLYGGLKEPDLFLQKWKAQYDKWVQTEGSSIPEDQRLEFCKIEDNIGNLGQAEMVRT